MHGHERIELLHCGFLQCFNRLKVPLGDCGFNAAFFVHLGVCVCQSKHARCHRAGPAQHHDVRSVRIHTNPEIFCILQNDDPDSQEVTEAAQERAREGSR